MSVTDEYGENLGREVRHILETSYARLGNPMILFDTEYNLMAYTDVVTDDPIFNELIAYGNFSYETQMFFMEEGFVDSAANTETVSFMISDKLKYNRMYGKLFNGDNLHVANLVMLAYSREFNENDPREFKDVCDTLSAELSKNDFYLNYGMEYQETYIKKLIDGSVKDKALYAAHISIVYSGLKANLFLAVADVSRSDFAEMNPAAVKERFKAAQPEFKYAVYSDHILMVMSTDEARLVPERDMAELNRLFIKHNIYAGVSSSFENVFEMRKYYDEALDALRHGVKLAEQRIFSHCQFVT